MSNVKLTGYGLITDRSTAYYTFLNTTYILHGDEYYTLDVCTICLIVQLNYICVALGYHYIMFLFNKLLILSTFIYFTRNDRFCYIVYNTYIM